MTNPKSARDTVTFKPGPPMAFAMGGFDWNIEDEWRMSDQGWMILLGFC